MTNAKRVSDQEIEDAKSPRGAWTRAQLAVWGVPWPPPAGWRRALILGEPIPKATPKCPHCGQPMPRQVDPT